MQTKQVVNPYQKSRKLFQRKTKLDNTNAKLLTKYTSINQESRENRNYPKLFGCAKKKSFSESLLTKPNPQIVKETENPGVAGYI